jgi:hypothetical protein
MFRVSDASMEFLHNTLQEGCCAQGCTTLDWVEVECGQSLGKARIMLSCDPSNQDFSLKGLMMRRRKRGVIEGQRNCVSP